ncbi:MAG TPA: hypothetical protein VFD10_08145 [Atribacterota bacterium]|nr:hypothetical protein [Atribacterota bacterium]
MIKLDPSKYKTSKFGDMAFNISERVKPSDTDLDIYVGLEHLDPECIHIRRSGIPSDVKGIKLRVYPGDIIFGKRRAYQRKAGLVDFDGICSAHAMVVRVNPKVILPGLFPFFMHSDLFMYRAVDISEGSLSPTIKWKIIAEEEFKLPPLDEQKRLADLLWSVDEVNQKYCAILNSLRKVKQAIIDNDLFKTKESNFKLREVGDVIRGVSFKPADKVYSKEIQKIVILRANNIRDNSINYNDIIYVKSEKVKEKQILKQRDFAICMSNGSKMLLGKAAEYQINVEDAVAVGAFCSIYRLSRSKELFDLVKYFFQSALYRRQVGLLLSGSNINNLKKSDILDLSIPNKTGKNNSIKKLIKIDEHESQLILQIEKIRAIKKQIINQIFGGKP